MKKEKVHPGTRGGLAPDALLPGRRERALDLEVGWWRGVESGHFGEFESRKKYRLRWRRRETEHSETITKREERSLNNNRRERPFLQGTP